MGLISRLPTTIDTAGLLSRWLLDGNALDSVGSRDGTWAGTAKYILDQKLGETVAYFNGSSYLSFDPTGLPSGAATRTVTLWFKGTAAEFGLFGYGSTAGSYYAYQIQQYGGDLYASLYGATLSTGFNPLSDGSWHHVALAYNGTTLLFYVDGVLYASASMTLVTALTLGKIGANMVASVWGNGVMCDCRIYSTAKTAAEVLAIAKFLA